VSKLGRRVRGGELEKKGSHKERAAGERGQRARKDGGERSV